MSKPLPVTFPCDDFAIVVGGKTYHPHEGETVTLFPDLTVGEISAKTALARIGLQIRAAEGDPDETAQIVALTDDHFNLICAGLADRIVDWTWTDRRGNPLPTPDGSLATIASLTSEEIAYLQQLKESMQETPADRKNGSRPSPTSSSATARRRRQR